MTERTVPPSTADVLREVALCASRAAERVYAGDHDVALDLASRALQWLDLALVELRGPDHLARG